MSGDDRPAGGRVRQGGAPPAAPPRQVRLPVNVHDWQNISFLHWPVDAAALARHLPDELAVLTREGTAWVGVTPFFIRVRPPRLPAVRWVTAFPETNVRTYAAGPDGREGVWFLHMEVTRTWFVATLRTLGLPYVRRRMDVEVGRSRITYTSREAAGGPYSHHVVVHPGSALSPPEGGARERFLTARWGAYHRRGPLLLYTPVDHPPWTLHAAEVGACEVAPLVRSAGLPPLEGPPLVHYSPGVTVKVGRPERVS